MTPIPAGPRVLSIALLALIAGSGCHDTPRPTDVATPAAEPPHASLGQVFDVGLMEYQVDTVTTARELPTRSRVVTPPAGSAWLIVAFRRTWRGENSITVPAMPFEIVTRAGLHIPGDIDGLSAHIERTNCGELGPTRLDSLRVEHNCEVFAVPVAQLEGATLVPSPAAHRGPQPRPIVSLGALVLAPPLARDP